MTINLPTSIAIVDLKAENRFRQTGSCFKKVVIDGIYKYMRNLICLNTLVFLSFLLISNHALSYAFNKAIMNLDNHPLIQSIEKQSLSLKQKGREAGSWGDPMFKLSGRNLTGNEISNPAGDPFAMQSIDFQVSQKVALTPTYGTLRKSFVELANAKKYFAQDHKRQLIRDLWINLIVTRHINEEITILKENLGWTVKNIAISKKLYTNGRIPQQVLLNVQIRKSEIESHLESKKFELKQRKEQLKYLIDLEGSLDSASIPWSFLETPSSQNLKDLKLMALEAQLKAKQLRLKAARFAYVPDLTFSVSYTRMLKHKEGFLSAGVLLPLPVSRKRYASAKNAVFEKEQSVEELLEYKRSKEYQKQTFTHNITKSRSQLTIIDQQSIAFAKNSKAITSKSYSFGRSNYQALLQSELQLQDLLIKRSLIKSELAKNQISYKYLVGDHLTGGNIEN